ncbi:hypothetical protein Y5A_009095 [Burkholderia glumae AU6208]|nr:hypothetical protein Y5A_009095 [Burkholderia glumae AU6208]
MRTQRSGCAASAFDSGSRRREREAAGAPLSRPAGGTRRRKPKRASGIVRVVAGARGRTDRTDGARSARRAAYGTPGAKRGSPMRVARWQVRARAYASFAYSIRSRV